MKWQHSRPIGNTRQFAEMDKISVYEFPQNNGYKMIWSRIVEGNLSFLVREFGCVATELVNSINRCIFKYYYSVVQLCRFNFMQVFSGICQNKSRFSSRVTCPQRIKVV